jgi:hypothetical protein
MIREWMESLPKTSATFTLGDIPDIGNISRVSTKQVEFLSSWEVTDLYHDSDQRARKFVNPNHVHAYRYTDLIEECNCGETICRNFKDGNNPLQNPHDHADDCKPQWRLSVRAAIAKQRERKLRELGPMGWQQKDFAPRFGMKAGSSCGGLPQQYGTSFGSFRDQYRQMAGNTYLHLVYRHDVHGETVADIYGHAMCTLSKWAARYGDFDREDGQVVQFEDSVQKPDWWYRPRAN